MAKAMIVKVAALEGNLVLRISPDDTGRVVFDRVVHSVGLEEFWYFGLTYETTAGEKLWVHLDKKVLDHDLKRKSPIEMVFKVKYYPEDPAEDVISDLALKYFYLQVQANIVADVIYCPADRALLLAAIDAQARYGNYKKSVHPKGYLFKHKRARLPSRVMKAHGLSKGSWERILTPLHAEKKGMCFNLAARKYLRIAQDLYGYGFKYFPVSMATGITWSLGIAPFGLHFYSPNEGFKPSVAFHWGEVKSMSLTLNNELVIQLKEFDRGISLSLSSVRLAKHVMRLCKGSCELYLRRHDPEPEEVQQLYAMAATSSILDVTQECQPLKEGTVLKEEGARYKEIQANIKQIEKERDKIQKETARLLMVAQRRREKAIKSLHDWQVAELKRRSQVETVTSLDEDTWMAQGIKLTEDHFADTGTIRKSSKQAQKKYEMAVTDRKEYHDVISEIEKLKNEMHSQITPGHLHVDEGKGIFEEDTNRIISIDFCPDKCPGIPWTKQQMAEDKFTDIRNDLQTMHSRLQQAQKKKSSTSDPLDLAYKTSTGGQSKYHFSRGLVKLPINARVASLELGDPMHPQQNGEHIYGVVNKVKNPDRGPNGPTDGTGDSDGSDDENPPPLPSRRPESLLHIAPGGVAAEEGGSDQENKDVISEGSEHSNAKT